MFPDEPGPAPAPVAPAEMLDTCACGHTLQRHALYSSCDHEGCDCHAWAPLAWYERACEPGPCICGDVVRRNEPRKGVVHNEVHRVCHLYCAPEPPPEPRSPFLPR